MSSTPPLDLADEGTRDALAAWLAAAAGADGARIEDSAPLTGGAIHQHWRIDVAFEGGPLAGDPVALVLRAEGDATLEESLSVAEEFAIARAAFEGGVAVPEPLWQCDDSVIGRAFSIWRFVEGVAAGHLLVRDETLGGPRPALLARLGEELARIQTLTPGHPGIEWLPVPEPSPALAAVATYRAALDAHPRPRPALEWGLRWLEREAPDTERLVLVHSDYRTGNFIVGEDGLRGVLDWEFARWGDPLEDPAWLSARAWRFNRYDRRAGGLGDLADFERGYGRELPPRALHYWEVMAHVRWAVIAIHQGERHSSGRQPSLELALTGRIVDEVELEVLTLIEEGERGDYGSGADTTAAPSPASEDAPPAADPLDGAALLEAARGALMDDLAPHVPGAQRYALLMADNAMGIAARELEAGEAPARRALAGLAAIEGAPAAGADEDVRTALRDAEARLTTQIRAGRYDAGPERAALAAWLRERSLDATRVSNPRFLARRGFA